MIYYWLGQREFVELVCVYIAVDSVYNYTVLISVMYTFLYVHVVD